MAALRKMRKDFAALAAKYPKEFGQLGPGTIDEQKLLLRFPVKNLSRAAPATRPAAGRSRPLPLQPRDGGPFFRFMVPMSPGVDDGRWLHLNVSFVWWWMWPNRPFSWKAQYDLMKMVSQALVPLNDLENATIAADLAKRPKGSYVLRGRPGVKLTIQRSPRRVARGTVVDLYATNETKGVLALFPPFTQIIGDGKPWHYRVHGSLLMRSYAFGSDRDPFLYIQPGQTAKVGAAIVAGLSADRHTVRVAAGHPSDYWVDMRPTIHDGSPITRKVAGAWTGVLVSGEMTIDIPTPAAAKKKAAERAKLLKKKTGTLYLVLQYHVGYIGVQPPSLHLATGVYKIELIGGILARLTPKEAANIIDHLAKEGFLGEAENIVGKDITPPQGPAYTLTLMGAGQTKLYQVLAWDLQMLRRLEALRQVLAKDSNAGKAMDKLLAALEPQRKKWQRPAAGKPAAEPAVKWGKAVNGLVCGISAFKPQVGLGVPYRIEVSIKNISEGDILLLKQQLEAGKEPLHDHVYFMQAGTTYREFFAHYLKGNFTGGPVRRQDFVLLRPGDIYKFTHGTLVYTGSITNDLKKAKGGLGLMGLTREGAYLMQVRYQPWFTLAKGVDLGGLKPWKGVLLSAPVEVVVGKDPAKPAVKWGKAVGGLVCGISACNPKVQVGVPYQFEVSVKNISKRDILLLKQRFTRKFPQPPLVARLFLLAGGREYRESFTFDRKSMAVAPARKEDFVLLKPGDIHTFTRRTLIYPRSMSKKFWNTEVNLGHMAVSREGVHQMHVKYEPRDLPIAKGTNLGGLKPWKGVLLSAPVEVMVPKAGAKRKTP